MSGNFWIGKNRKDTHYCVTEFWENVSTPYSKYENWGMRCPENQDKLFDMIIELLTNLEDEYTEPSKLPEIQGKVDGMRDWYVQNRHELTEQEVI